jgi:hypothetical protein
LSRERANNCNIDIAVPLVAKSKEDMKVSVFGTAIAIWALSNLWKTSD